MSAQVFIIAAPRSGAGFLHKLLLLDESFHAGPLTSDENIVSFLEKGLTKNNYEFGEKKTKKLTPAQKLKLQTEYGSRNLKSSKVVVDYNPRLSVHVSELADAFPDAKFIFVTRNPIRAELALRARLLCKPALALVVL